jgi:hypothetical protein
VARAKRTDRAEARRRYRATLSEEELDPIEGDEELEAPATARPVREAPRGRSAAAAAPPPPRTSITAAFKNSFRPLDIPADLRALPRLLLDKSVFIPVALTVASTVAILAAPGQVATLLAFQYFVLPPPVAAIFIAGFLAPRASYLTGAVAGLVGAIGFSVWLTTAVGQTNPATGAVLTAGEVQSQIVAGFFTAIISGMFFGGAAGWYRRFLALANPSRAARMAGRTPPNRSGKRGGDGRPLLARRR